MNYALLVTLLVGLFIMVGALIVFKTKNSDKIVNFSISIALGVMASLAILELIPESYESFYRTFKDGRAIILVISSALIGIGLLKVLDHFIPDHHEENKSKKAKHEHLFHIGIVSSVALSIHNVIEGMALYTATTADLKMGLLMCLGIGLHNIPMGMVIASTLYNSKKDARKTVWLLFVISLSTFVGGFLIYIVSPTLITDNVLGVLLGITLGMIVYIVGFELIPQVRKMPNKKNSIIGMIVGAFILVLSVLI